METNPIRRRFADQLRALRREAGWTQQETADKLGIKRSTYAYYETHTSEPDLQVLAAMARLFHTSVDYLVGNMPRSVLLRQRAAEPVVLNEEEQHAVLLLRGLNPTDRTAWLADGEARLERMMADFPDETEIRSGDAHDV